MKDELAKATKKNCKHIASSYAWGDSRANTGDQLRIEESHPKPLVLRDAVEIVIRLGIRYTCIDKVCIKQKYGKGKRVRSQQCMRLNISIVDATRSDSNHGLWRFQSIKPGSNQESIYPDAHGAQRQ